MKIRSVGAELFRADGKTDRHDETSKIASRDIYESSYQNVLDVERFMVWWLITGTGYGLISRYSNRES